MKRIAVLGLLVVGLLVWGPSTALADPPTHFEALGEVTTSPTGDVRALAHGFITTNEFVDVKVSSSSGWDDLNGATLNTVHRSLSRLVSPDGSFVGHGTGVITVTTASKQVLSGPFSFEISGHLDIATDILLDINDSGHFSIGGAGTSNSHANGSFTLVLSGTTSSVDISGSVQNY